MRMVTTYVLRTDSCSLVPIRVCMKSRLHVEMPLPKCLNTNGQSNIVLPRLLAEVLRVVNVVMEDMVILISGGQLTHRRRLALPRYSHLPHTNKAIHAVPKKRNVCEVGRQAVNSRQSVGSQSAIRRGMRQSRARLSSLRVDPIEVNQAAIRRQSGARQRSLRVDPLFAERNIIKPFPQQFGVERTGLLPEEAGGLWQRVPAEQKRLRRKVV